MGGWSMQYLAAQTEHVSIRTRTKEHVAQVGAQAAHTDRRCAHSMLAAASRMARQNWWIRALLLAADACCTSDGSQDNGS